MTDTNPARSRVEEQTRIRRALLKGGYVPLANRDKLCVLPGWPSLKVDAAAVDAWSDMLRYVATGIRVDGPMVVLDFDIDDAAMLDLIWDRLPDDLVRLLDSAPLRFGGGAKFAVFLRRAEGDGPVFGRMVSQGYAPPGVESVMRVEVFDAGAPRQFGVYGVRSHDAGGAVETEYRWAGGWGLADVPLKGLPAITLDQIKAVLDCASAAMREAGWHYEVATHSGVVDGRPRYDIAEDAIFVTADHGEIVGVDALAELCSVEGPGLRLSASWLEGGSAVNTQRCIARLNVGDGRLQIWETAACVLHRPAGMDVRAKIEGLAERLRSRGSAGGAAETGGGEGGGLSRLEALLASVPPEDRYFALSAEEAGGGGVASKKQAIDVTPGRMSEAVETVASRLAGMPHLFNMGGRIVGVSRAGRGALVPMTDHRMAFEIGRHFRCVKEGKKGAAEVDTPPALVNQTLAYAAESGFRPLRGLVDMPVLTRAGGVVCDDYDEESQLVVLDSLGVGGALVAGWAGGGVVGDEEARAALEALWAPFSQFPFVGPLDRGGALAAVLTAVARTWLPTAPLFAFDAPAQGSGKSLLCRAIGALSGGYSLQAPLPLRDEDEVRKVMLTLLMTAPRAVIFDNQLGLVDSAVLGGVLTAETFAGRMLGTNTLIEAPTNMLVLLNGNNLLIGGDMPRRTVRVRIDPQMETPFERRFDFDPETEVRRGRGVLVVAALTLLRWGLQAAGGGRIGSFERWDEVVGQTVARIGSAVDARFGDPADLIRLAHVSDPTRDDLNDLLTALRAEFGNKWFGSSEVTARMAGASGPLFEAFGYDKVPNSKAVGRHLGNRRDAKVGGLRLQMRRDAHTKTSTFRVVDDADSDGIVVEGELEKRRAEQRGKLSAVRT